MDKKLSRKLGKRQRFYLFCYTGSSLVIESIGTKSIAEYPILFLIYDVTRIYINETMESLSWRITIQEMQTT